MLETICSGIRKLSLQYKQKVIIRKADASNKKEIFALVITITRVQNSTFVISTNMPLIINK